MKCFEIVIKMAETSKRRSYDFKFKQVVIEYAEENNNRGTVKAHSTQRGLLLKGGFYSKGASIQGRLLIEKYGNSRMLLSSLQSLTEN